MKKQKNGGKETKAATIRPQFEASQSHVTIDFAKYVHHLDGLDLTDAEALQLLQTLSMIACEFVALGFNVHPIQQAKNACGQGAVLPETQPIQQRNEVSLLGQFIKENVTDCAEPEADRVGERVET